MEHQQRQGSEAEDGGLRPGFSGSQDHPSDVPGDGGKVRGSFGLGFQRRRPVGDPDVEGVL